MLQHLKQSFTIIYTFAILLSACDGIFTRLDSICKCEYNAISHLSGLSRRYILFLKTCPLSNHESPASVIFVCLKKLDSIYSKENRNATKWICTTEIAFLTAFSYPDPKLSVCTSILVWSRLNFECVNISTLQNLIALQVQRWFIHSVHFLR